MGYELSKWNKNAKKFDGQTVLFKYTYFLN